MFLKYRPIRPQDLEECLRCLRDGFAYDTPAREQLMAFWREGLRDGTFYGALIEDTTAPLRQRIFYFILKACLTDEYTHSLRTTAPPLLGRRILDHWLGGQSPCLALDQIRAANSGRGIGLNMVTLYSGAPGFATREGTTEVGNKIVEWTDYSTCGYRLQEYMIEVYGESEWTWCEQGGFTLYQDYPDCEGVPVGKHPRLYGVTAAQSAANYGSTAAHLFRWQLPCFFFRPLEQQMLLHALGGDTDEELSAALDIALITVKKRWLSIYDRVADVAPEIFGAISSGEKRGVEKKRHLLRYLRHHLEELRPLESGRAKRSGGGR